ncbi:MAG TPA: bifunctional aspartate kinase/homoserine dehydrogenase I [Puia sp.]|nr:bifunctional aspartate kinase/homoserine dehydrogenase I [Puia sp.]
MQVLKFGGTSVANADNIRKVAAIVREKVKEDRIIVIVSAFGGITDALLQCGVLAEASNELYKEKLHQAELRHIEAVRSLIPMTHQSSILSRVKKSCNEIEDICKGVFMLGELSERTKDKIMSFGELLSSQIISAHFASVEMNCTWKDTRALIRTDSRFGSAGVDFKVTNGQIAQYFAQDPGSLYILPGFVASDNRGSTTTLGRGGSDYTAAIISAGVDATRAEIWTDVSGMMTADPRLVETAKVIPQISYQEAMELSHFGAKVIYPPTIQPMMRKSIPVWIKNTFAPDDRGTVIESIVQYNGSSIRGISSMSSIALLSLEGSGMVGIPGFSKRLFESLANQKINVILITQSSSEHSICVAIDEKNLVQAKTAVDFAFEHEISSGKVDPLSVERGLAIVALVGDNMKNHTGISGKMFGSLGRNGVNIRAIAQGSSERNISAVMSAVDVKKAITVLHEEFFETSFKQINLFITGVGNVGSRFLSQLQQQKKHLLEHLRLEVNVIGLANSKKMIFDDEGLDLEKWKEQLESGESMKLDKFIEIIRSKNLGNAVFADITANDEVAMSYERLLQKSISVIACNKVACSSSYNYYKKLKNLSREYNALFLFETNVGAGLPVIGTLNDLIHSGDKINKIEAVLSGTLNFVFNNYNSEEPFAEVVRRAQKEGYTEPDPRLDLSGTDVMRKIMILARESGEKIEMEDIANHSFMPASCMKGSIIDFYQTMADEEPHFKRIYDEAASKGMKLKFVASFKNGKASVGLRHIDPAHNLYHLYGKDNVVLFYTERYPEQPLVVKGAGAGAEVTASGVFADVIRAARI